MRTIRTIRFFIKNIYYNDNHENGVMELWLANSFDQIVNNGGGPHIINIQDPVNPVFVSEFNTEGYSHDAQIVVYNGPDTDHTGKVLYFGANEDKVVIVDMTNQLAPVTISTFTYSNTAYTHQGWLTENHKYFLYYKKFATKDFEKNKIKKIYLINEKNEINFDNIKNYFENKCFTEENMLNARLIKLTLKNCN